MSLHPTADELILHYYRDEAPDDASRVDDHVRSCGSCRVAWSELTETMALVDRAEPAEPAADFERRMWAQVRATLPLAQPRWSGRQVVPLATWAAMVIAIAGVQAWRVGERATPPTAAVGGEATTDAHRRVLFTALNEHFGQTEMLLVELANAPDQGHAEFAFERDTAADLVASGRLYRNTARQTGDLHLVALFDDLEAVLVDVARGPADPAPADVELLRARIDHGDLLFKVRAVTQDIRGRQPTLHTESE